MLQTVTICSVFACKKSVVAHGLCDTHYKRMRRHGTVEAGRRKDWGERAKHPLYGLWKSIRRNHVSVVPEWHDDFWRFVEDVVAQPKGTHLVRTDPSLPLGPGNAQWSNYKATVDLNGHSTDRHAVYMREYQRKRRAADPLHGVAEKLKREGLTIDDYEVMLERQGGVCAVCGRGEHRLNTYAGSGTFRLSVDHDHATGAVRGLLCSPCNHALGIMDDRPELLRRMIDYLENPPAAGLALRHKGVGGKRRRQRPPSPHAEVRACA